MVVAVSIVIVGLANAIPAFVQPTVMYKEKSVVAANVASTATVFQINAISAPVPRIPWLKEKLVVAANAALTATAFLENAILGEFERFAGNFLYLYKT